MISEVRIFLTDDHFALGDRLSDERWIMKLAYLADIFKKLNDLSLSLQGEAVTVFEASDKVQAFRKKIKFWAESMKNGILDSFPMVKEFTEQLDSDIPGDALNYFHVHLLSLLDSFNCYFPEELHKKIEEQFWVVNPYSLSEKPACLTSQQYECLIDLTSDSAIKEKFATKKSLSEFWCQLKDEFKVLSDKAKIILLPFATTYLCESGFSAYVSTKTKYRSRLNAEPDIRLKLSQIQPDIVKLCKSKQSHPSR
jgi:hypothetical protein